MIDRDAEVRQWLDYRGLAADTTLRDLIEHEREIAAHAALSAYWSAKSAVVPVRAISDTWSAHLGNVCFAIGVPRLRAGDRIVVSFYENGNVWHGRVLGVRPGVGGEMWIDATQEASPVASDSDGTAQVTASLARPGAETAPLAGRDAGNASGASEAAAREVP